MSIDASTPVNQQAEDAFVQDILFLERLEKELEELEIHEIIYEDYLYNEDSW